GRVASCSVLHPPRTLVGDRACLSAARHRPDRNGPRVSSGMHRGDARRASLRRGTVPRPAESTTGPAWDLSRRVGTPVVRSEGGCPSPTPGLAIPTLLLRPPARSALHIAVDTVVFCARHEVPPRDRTQGVPRCIPRLDQPTWRWWRTLLPGSTTTRS